jgi:hypothetical protein
LAAAVAALGAVFFGAVAVAFEPVALAAALAVVAPFFLPMASEVF